MAVHGAQNNTRTFHKLFRTHYNALPLVINIIFCCNIIRIKVALIIMAEDKNVLRVLPPTAETFSFVMAMQPAWDELPEAHQLVVLCRQSDWNY